MNTHQPTEPMKTTPPRDPRPAECAPDIKDLALRLESPSNHQRLCADARLAATFLRQQQHLMGLCAKELELLEQPTEPMDKPPVTLESLAKEVEALKARYRKNINIAAVESLVIWLIILYLFLLP